MDRVLRSYVASEAHPAADDQKDPETRNRSGNPEAGWIAS